MLAQPDVRMIKKYQNRKLYDTKNSCYITLEDIAKMVKVGEEVRVIDNKTKNDVTSIILTQILVDQEKATKSILPLTMLRDIIQKGEGSLFDFIQRYVLLGVNSSQEKMAEAERYINRLVDRGDLSKSEAKSLLKEVENAPETNQDDFDSFVANRVTDAVRNASSLSTIQTKMDSIINRLSEIEDKLYKVENR
ncbi:MAG: polyhydroxyalkanoate synthesis regulator DNA-binding domain-containing protein [Bdellovibrionota bacterium]|nr:regulator for granula-associated protein [Deltaproteobacteria bacterium]